jgi:hypothetical protein
VIFALVFVFIENPLIAGRAKTSTRRLKAASQGASAKKSLRDCP